MLRSGTPNGLQLTDTRKRGQPQPPIVRLWKFALRGPRPKKPQSSRRYASWHAITDSMNRPFEPHSTITADTNNPEERLTLNETTFDLSTRRKERAALLFEQIITHNRLELADEIFAPDFYWPQFDLRGPEGVRDWVRAFRTAFPDMEDHVVEQFADGDTVVSKVRCVGTQSGPFRGLPPSGQVADFTAIGIDRFEGDLIVERSAWFDIVDLMRQLGHTTLEVPALNRP